MIRHHHAHEYFLFSQDDHARLSGRLAEHFGNTRFAAPDPPKSVVDAIRLHDSGWPLHDREPTLNEEGLPLHVFETPIPLSVRVWSESVRLARQCDHYTGLLVSLHVFGLSAHSYQDYADPHERRRHAKELFELNKFQQSQIEAQEQIRTQMGLRTDMPLELGLAPRGSGAAEDLLRFNYKLLKAMDQLSLSMLCGNRPFITIEDVHPRPGFDPLDMRVGYPTPWTVTLSPWPFNVEQIAAEVPFRRVPSKPYADVEAFRVAYAAAPREMQMVQVMKSAV